MRQLRSCDFCGDDAAGAFEVVPPALNPAEGEQRRVLLCESCRDRLDELLEPLLDRLNATDGADPREASSTDREASATDGGGAVGASARNAGAAERDSSSSADPSAANEAPSSDADGETANSTDASSTSSASSTANETAGGSAGSPSNDAADGPGGITLEDGSDESGDTGNATDDAAGSDSGPASGPPPAYGKAMRLLSNREFPMPRREVETLIAGAYDLEDPEVEAIIDHAVKTGRLADDGGTLRRA